MTTKLATALEPIEEFPTQIIARHTEQARALMEVVESRGLYIVIDGKKYLEVEAWEIIGWFNGIVAVPVSVTPWVRGDVQLGWQATVHLVDRQGQVRGAGFATCGFDSFSCLGKTGSARDKAAESAAQTWATSKAYRLNFSPVAILGGYQALPAEEARATGMGTPEEQAAREKDPSWCAEHRAVWFKRGRMRRFAHPIQDSQGATTGWCNMPAPIESVPEEAPDSFPPPVLKTIGDLFNLAQRMFGQNSTQVMAMLGVSDPRAISDLGRAWNDLVALQAKSPAEVE